MHTVESCIPTGCHVLGFVNEYDVIASDTGPLQLVQLKIGVMSDQNLVVVQVDHLLPHFGCLVGIVLFENVKRKNHIALINRDFSKLDGISRSYYSGPIQACTPGTEVYPSISTGLTVAEVLP